jgi:hypothetical protein
LAGRAARAAITDGMLQGDQHTGAEAMLVGLVHQYRAALDIACLLKRDRDGGIKQAVAGGYQGGLGVAVSQWGLSKQMRS